jgi:hypothetical protein
MRVSLAFVMVLVGCGTNGASPPAPEAERAVAPPPALPAAPTPPAPAASARDGDLEWSLRASATTITMDERAGWTLATVARNVGESDVDYFEAGLSSYRLDGLASIALEMAFSNGISPASWSELSPGESAEPERGGLGETLFPAEGDYEIVMTHGAAVVGVTIHVLPSIGAPPVVASASGPSVRDGDLEWRLAASSTTVAMAARDAWELRTEATNVGTAAVDVIAAGTGTFTVDGVPSRTLDMAFGNGGFPGSYRALPPGETATNARDVGEILETPGDHTIEMTIGGGITVSLVVHVTP